MRDIKLMACFAAALLGQMASSWAADNNDTDPFALATRAGCTYCHDGVQPRIGPPLLELARRYKGQGAVDSLVAKIRAGGSRGHGNIGMGPVPETLLSDQELRVIIAWMIQDPQPSAPAQTRVTP